MFKLLDGGSGNVMGIEIVEEYTKEDVTQLQKMFEELVAAGHDRINLLCKIDQLKLIPFSGKCRHQF